jgi:hypothetical protein
MQKPELFTVCELATHRWSETRIYYFYDGIIRICFSLLTLFLVLYDLNVFIPRIPVTRNFNLQCYHSAGMDRQKTGSPKQMTNRSGIFSILLRPYVMAGRKFLF